MEEWMTEVFSMENDGDERIENAIANAVSELKSVKSANKIEKEVIELVLDLLTAGNQFAMSDTIENCCMEIDRAKYEGREVNKAVAKALKATFPAEYNEFLVRRDAYKKALDVIKKHCQF